MPDEKDDRELGAAPTAITSVVPEQRNREATQQLPIPSEADPPWSADALPKGATGHTMDTTYPQAIPPTPTPRQRARVWSRHLLHEFKKLPARTRTLIVVTFSVLGGLLLGLVLAPRGAPQSTLEQPGVPEPELVKHARRLSLPERAAVVRALEQGDELAALMMLRAMSVRDHLAADPLAVMLRGRLALVARDGVDALDNFEAALAAQPGLVDEQWLPAAVVQTYAANKTSRTTALLVKLPREGMQAALGAACMDWQARVRHSAADALKSFSLPCPDGIGAAVVDAYQADKCDAARAAVQKLAPLLGTDDRVAAALDAVSRRPAVASCVAELIPRPPTVK
ncbi:MAG: hypothetical protein IPJ65_43900 [Archangiaceae bacterium]|nr:hypothetical protein [Archangiaceae bacterium]